MSMLSSQVDELRELATRYDELQVGAVKAVTMPSNMGSILRDAADTIWELRDDLQRANAENASLRERVDAAHMSRLLNENENAKLRELAAGIGHLLFKLDVDYCAGCPRDDINHPCPVYTVKGGECLYETDLRDLGVEVTE